MHRKKIMIKKVKKKSYLLNLIFWVCNPKHIFFWALKVHSKVWDNFGNWKPFKKDEKCFLFHLKSYFRSQDNFCFDILVIQKSGMIIINNISNILDDKQWKINSWHCVKKFPNTEFYLVRIFPYLERIRTNTDQEKLRIRTFFAQCERSRNRYDSVTGRWELRMKTPIPANNL